MTTLMRNGRDRRSENPFWADAILERVVVVGTDQRITSGPAAKRPHSKVEYMTAPERFADSQIPLAPRAPSIHDPNRASSSKLIWPGTAPEISEKCYLNTARENVQNLRKHTGESIMKYRCPKYRFLMTSMALMLISTQVAPAQDLASSVVGVWKLTSFSTREVTTEKVSKPFGEHPSGYFFFTHGGNVAFFAVGQDRKLPASPAPTDAERAELYKTMIAAFTGTYKVEAGTVTMQVDASWNQAWTGTQQPRNIQIASSQLTVTTPPLKNLISGQEIVVTAIFDRAE
jgi:hypothetical protein